MFCMLQSLVVKDSPLTLLLVWIQINKQKDVYLQMQVVNYFWNIAVVKWSPKKRSLNMYLFFTYIHNAFYEVASNAIVTLRFLGSSVISTSY